jgi:hypothetical protein
MAHELAERHLMVCYRAEYAGGWKYQCIDSHIATDLDSLMHERFIIGGLAQCVAPMRRFVDVFEVTHLICRWFFPGKLLPHIEVAGPGRSSRHFNRVIVGPSTWCERV